MAESSYPAGAGTRVANDSQYEALASSWSAPGILGTPNDTAVVYADGTGTRVVKVRANKRGIIRGWGWYSGSTDFSMASLAANSSGSTRTDTVVLRFSRSSYTVAVAVITGTPGAGAPALTQSIAEPLTSGTFDVPLATVSVANGATTISSGNVTPVTWYSEGSTLVLNSDATYQPATSIGVTSHRHYDTGISWKLVAGAWRAEGLYKATTVLGSSSSSVSLTIPSYLETVRITWRARGTASSATWVEVDCRVNNVTTGLYNVNILQLSNTSFFNAQHNAIDKGIAGYMPSATTSASSYGHGTLDFPGWAATTQFLTWTTTSYFFHDNVGNSFLNFIGNQLQNTGARTSVQLFPGSGSFAAGSRFQVVGTP